MSYPSNKYEQIMPSYFLSVNCFEDNAIYVIKNLLQLTKDHLVPKGELLVFQGHSHTLKAS